MRDVDAVRRAHARQRRHGGDALRRAGWSCADSVRDPVGLLPQQRRPARSATLEAMAAEGCRQFVFSSTCARLRRAGRDADSRRRIRQRRSTPTARPSWRSSTRCRTSSAPTASGRSALRYFNAAGADPDGELGEDHAPEIHVIPRAIRGGSRRRADRHLRRGLSDAGRHLPSRLHPRHRPGGCARPRARSAGGRRRVGQLQRRHGAAVVGEGRHRRGRARRQDVRSRGGRRRVAPAIRRYCMRRPRGFGEISAGCRSGPIWIPSSPTPGAGTPRIRTALGGGNR